MNLKRTKLPLDTENTTLASPTNPSQSKQIKLELVFPKDQEYKYTTTIKCTACNAPVEESDALKAIKDKILECNSPTTQASLAAWKTDLTTCTHITNLQPVVQKNDASEYQYKAGHCVSCDIKENLWMCLHCGTLGCGRIQYGGVGGNGHAEQHFKNTGHQVVVKLETCSKYGEGDVFCYGCGDEKMDESLKQHLKNFEIDMDKMEKTGKSMDEMQIEHNLKFEFSMTTEDGKELSKAYGKALTGIKNLGNTCYMASVFQCLLSLKPFKQSFYDDLATHQSTCKNQQATCYECQMFKLTSGMIEGKYSFEKQIDGAIESGITPTQIKSILGKNHAEFSTMRQQDVFEYIQHFMAIEAQHPGSRSQLKSVFEFKNEQRLECSGCGGVNYKHFSDQSMGLFVENVEGVTFKDCLEEYFKESTNEGYKCSGCGDSCGLKSVNRMSSYPPVLMIVLKRFIVDTATYTMKKLSMISMCLI